MSRISKTAWIVIGLAVLGLVLWAIGVPGQTLLTIGFVGGMMLMHGSHGSHGGHGGGSGSDQHIGHDGSERHAEGAHRPGGHER